MKNKETCLIVGGAKEGSHGNNTEGSGSDEEIPSDSEEETQELEQDGDDVISDQSEDEGKEHSTVSRKQLKRKRKRPDWVKYSLNNLLLHSLISHSLQPFVSLFLLLSIHVL